MKNKYVFSALFIGLFSVEMANAECPGSITYSDFQDLKNPNSNSRLNRTCKIVSGSDFKMNSTDTAKFMSKHDNSNPPKRCFYTTNSFPYNVPADFELNCAD